MRLSRKRKVTNFVLKKCGLRRLSGSKVGLMIRSVLDEIDLQHVRDANPCQSCTGRLEMYRYVDETSIRQEAIDYLEFGVFQGESIRRWTNLNKNKDSRFFGFDSFEGL